jgi:hypothetical protein
MAMTSHKVTLIPLAGTVAAATFAAAAAALAQTRPAAAPQAAPAPIDANKRAPAAAATKPIPLKARGSGEEEEIQPRSRQDAQRPDKAGGKPLTPQGPLHAKPSATTPLNAGGATPPHPKEAIKQRPSPHSENCAPSAGCRRALLAPCRRRQPDGPARPVARRGCGGRRLRQAPTTRRTPMKASPHPIVALVCSAALAAPAAAEPVKPPQGSGAAPAPTRSAITPSQPPTPMRADDVKAVQPRALPPAPPSPRKPDQNKRPEASGQTSAPAGPPPKAADGKR